MVNYTKFDSKMETEKHFKDKVILKKQMRTIIFLWAIFLLPISLSAQIRISEDKPKEKEPEWLKYKNIIYAPYDSSYLYVKNYPTLEAYKKYIGQQLYLPSLYIKGGGTRGHASLLMHDSYSSEYDSYLWHPFKIGLYVPQNDDKFVTNKYYTIIDVLSLTEADSMGHTKGMHCLAWIKDRVELTKDYTFSITYDDRNIVPYFVLKETQSGDTVYTLFPESFILVGGFVKMRQNCIGLNIFELTEYPNKNNISKNIIKEKWICSDVALKIPPNDTYNNDVIVNLILQNVDDKRIEKEIDYGLVDNRLYWTKKDLDNTLAKITADEKKRENEDAAYKQRLVQEKAKRKQDLIDKYGTTMAEKIIAGKYEIGMNKAVCKEIAGYANVVDKTATTEKWKIGYFWTGNATYLYFSGDILVRIVNL